MTKDIENKSSSFSKFENILPDLFTVFKNANQDAVTSEALPVDFFEENPIKIVESLHAHQVDQVTSLEHKFKENQYNSPYGLYHDIKVVSSILLNKQEIGSTEYKEYDFFYKFATELLLRELGNSIAFKNQFPEIKTELESQIEEDFDKISNSYNLSNGEVITYISTTEESDQANGGYYLQQYANQPKAKRVQPLFSSVISKSELDNRQSIIKEPYGIAKVISSAKDTVSDNILDNLSPMSNKIPSPLDQPTNILHDFFHPTWYTVSMPQWLTYKSQTIKPATLSSSQELDVVPSTTNLHKLSILQKKDREFTTNATSIWGPGNYYSSLAPSRDLTRSIVAHKLRADIWLQHIGIAEIAKIKKEFMEKKDANVEEKKTNQEEKENEKVKNEEKESDSDTKSTKEKDETTIETKEIPTSDEINIANLVHWNPAKLEELKYLKSHKQELINPKKLQKMISISLLKLNKARQERFERSDVRNPLTPDHEEYILYNRLVKLITIAIRLFKLNPGSFSYEFSKKIPVLATEFSGTLPGVAPNKILGNNATISSNKLNRLPNLKGPTSYRKRPSRY